MGYILVEVPPAAGAVKPHGFRPTSKPQGSLAPGLKIHKGAPLHAPQMAGIVNGDDIPGLSHPLGVFHQVKAVDAGSVLGDAPEMGIFQADESGNENISENYLKYPVPSCAVIPLQQLELTIKKPRPSP
jgi:hypothetical protein